MTHKKQLYKSNLQHKKKINLKTIYTFLRFPALLLKSCIKSLLSQSQKVDIYLSISFDSDNNNILQKVFEKAIIHDDQLHIFIQQQKTAQFKHIELMVNIIKNNYEWILFCDDDDTYNNQRVEYFMYMISEGLKNISSDKILSGAYENKDLKSHTYIFYEYWSYCVNIKILQKFFTLVNQYDNDLLNHKYCDMFFASFLRCLNNKNIFVSADINMYNYTQHSESITGKIKDRKTATCNFVKDKVTNFEVFINGLNDHVIKHIDTCKNNIFLHTIFKKDLNYALSITLGKEYNNYIDHFDKKTITELTEYHAKIKNICCCMFEQY